MKPGPLQDAFWQRKDSRGQWGPSVVGGFQKGELKRLRTPNTTFLV